MFTVMFVQWIFSIESSITSLTPEFFVGVSIIHEILPLVIPRALASLILSFHEVRWNRSSPRAKHRGGLHVWRKAEPFVRHTEGWPQIRWTLLTHWQSWRSPWHSSSKIIVIAWWPEKCRRAMKWLTHRKTKYLFLNMSQTKQYFHSKNVIT